MISQSHQNQLILASASIYRKEQMQRFRIPFTCQAAEIDEAALPGESTAQQTARLALKKAETVAVSFPDAYIIGSDQLADFAGQRVGKPGSEEKAVAQLLQFSGRKVSFLSSVALICKTSGFRQTDTVTTEVEFRSLTEAEARRYVALDVPMDCAGAFRSEMAGPMLLQSMSSSDPTAIIGLPLITVARMLRQAGFPLP